MGQLETAQVGTQCWTRRFPRLTAVFVSMAFGSAVALVMSAISLSLNVHFDAFGLLLHLEGTMVLITSVWAFVLFGPYTRGADRGPWWAILAGVACVMLTISTIALYETSMTCYNLKLFCFRNGFFFSNTWFNISFAMLGSLFIAFLPQVAGAFGGFVIWRLTRDART